MATRPYHHGDLRAALLASAERALAEHGPSALSLRELAREAGVSHAAPGRHFRDKQALLDALALTGFERLIAWLEEALAEKGDARSQVLALTRVYARFASEHAALLELMYTRKHDPDASERLSATVARMLNLMMRPILHGQSAKEIVDGDPRTIADTVAATMQGFITIHASSPRVEVDARLADAVDILFDGLTPR